ncbi:hypothetical protein MAR_010170 [Mya arenaria]|uniref:Uncharacterized protein n=1 Tax=Mya arenaria TaxID=6604 RepID=A0ABY7E473_MYAAR|nr:hypothetical protein MAR_010170 [Mya arenaria]
MAKPNSRSGTSKTSGSKPVPSRAGSIRSGMTAITEDDDDDDGETLGTELSAMVPRATYKPPANYHSPSMARFEAYLEKTEVQNIFRKLLHMLISRPELPYNPFPGFSGRIRMYQERFHLQRDSKEHILRCLNNDLESSYIQNLYTIKHYRNVWGAISILKVVNPDALEKYRWLIDDLTPQLDQLPAMEGYSNQVMVALVGPAVFDGSFYSSVHSIQVRLEFLVTGFDVTQGISIFVNSLMKEIDLMFSSEHHFLLGVSVPALSPLNPEVWVKHYWEPEKIQTEKETFLQRLSDAVIGNRYVSVECIFLQDPSYMSYVRGEKQYGFNFIEVIDEMKEEGDDFWLSSFCEYPMSSLHEGVFFDRAHAEAYISIFHPQFDDFETAEPYEAGEGAPPKSPGIVSLGEGTMAGNDHLSRAATARSMNHPFSSTQQQDVNNVQQHVHNRLDHMNPRRVKIDGFRFGDEKSSGPFSWQITTPIKSNYQRKISGYWREVELFEIAYSVIMLVLMDREAFGDDILVEVWRLLHGTSGGLHLLMEYNKGLRAIIQAVANTSDYPMIRPLLKQYQESVEKLFLNPLLERSQDQITVGRSIAAKVEDMIFAPDMEFASASHLQFTLRGLKNINLYLIPLLMELAEDSLPTCPEITKLVTTFEDAFPEEDPRPPTRYKKRAQATSFQKKTANKTAGQQEEVEDEVIRHGVEDEHIKRHETSVINMKACIARDMSPQAMVKENVLMKYMLDCHIDDVWNSYLIELAGGDVFPPNPFPRLISILRQSAMKMDLFYDKSSVVTEKMFNLEVKLIDAENFIYNVPGIDAYGTLTSLMMLDTGIYIPLAQIFQKFQQKSYIQKKGPYRVGICLALSGPVHNHMVDMITKSGLPVMGVYFGSPSPDHWTADDILGKKKGFMTQPEIFYPDDPASFFQSIFLSKDRAAFHYQNCGPPQGGDPMSLANVRAVTGHVEKAMFETQRKGDWLQFYRHLLLRDLISQV